MANVSILFGGSLDSKSSDDAIEVYALIDYGININIIEQRNHLTSILLDKETAIKFSKELRKQISLLED